MQYYNRSQNKKKVTVQIWKSCSCELEEIRLNPLLHLLCIWTISRNDYKGFLPTEIIKKKIQEGSTSVTDVSSLLKMRHLGLDCLSQLAVTLCCYSPYLVHCLLNCRSTANLCLVLTPSPHQGKSVAYRTVNTTVPFSSSFWNPPPPTLWRCGLVLCTQQGVSLLIPKATSNQIVSNITQKLHS